VVGVARVARVVVDDDDEAGVPLDDERLQVRQRR
jgi:hypothetical protein